MCLEMRSTAMVTALAMCAAACAGEGDWKRHTGCPSSGASHSPGQPADTVTAGQPYKRTLHFDEYPCIRETNCRWEVISPYIPLPVPVCDRAQASCGPALWLLRAPPAARLVEGVVEWQPTRADEGLVAEFEVEAQYPATCPQSRQAGR